jgi:hypothetical protein
MKEYDSEMKTKSSVLSQGKRDPRIVFVFDTMTVVFQKEAEGAREISEVDLQGRDPKVKNVRCPYVVPLRCITVRRRVMQA